MRTMNRRIRTRLIRAAVQVFFFVMAPGLYSAAFGGVRAVFGQFHLRQPVTLSSFVALLAVLCGYTFVCGRFFCGWACAFGGAGDLLYEVTSWIRRSVNRFRGKPKRTPLRRIPLLVRRGLQYVKYGILVLIAALSLLGLYGKISFLDPWEMFGSLTSLDFSVKGKEASLIVLLLTATGMCVEERFFCKFLCPMGAVFSLLPVLPFSQLTKDPDSCIPHCGGSRQTPPRGLCSQNCPADLSILDYSGECIQCMKCIDICPKENIRTGIRRLRGNEILLVLAKAAVLFVICRPWM